MSYTGLSLPYICHFHNFKITFRGKQSDQSCLTDRQYPPWKDACHNRVNVIQQYLINLPPIEKLAKFDFSDL